MSRSNYFSVAIKRPSIDSTSARGASTNNNNNNFTIVNYASKSLWKYTKKIQKHINVYKRRLAKIFEKQQPKWKQNFRKTQYDTR